MDKKFYLTSARSLQRVGLRAQVVSFLIERGIQRGNALNEEGDPKKVVVAVSLPSAGVDAKAEERAIEKIRDDLVSHLNRLSALDPECYAQIPGDIRGSELYDLGNPHQVNVVDLQLVASGLMLEQTSKGVGAMLSLSRAITPLATLPAAIKELAVKIGVK